MKKLFTLLSLVLATTTLFAQFVLNGEIRPRTEFKHGYKTLTNANTDFDLATSQRTRLGFNYKQEIYSVGIQLQDVRTWGSQSQLVANDGALTTIHQAWAQIKLCEVTSLKVGRQELVYDDSRILGNVGWAQQARSHDIALFKAEKKDNYKLHFGAAVNQVQTIAYATAGNYKSMQFLWFNKSFGDSYKFSFLALNNGVEDVNGAGNPTTTYSQIIGQRSVYKAGKLTAGLNLYYQMGMNMPTKSEKSAYNIGLDVNYKISDNLSAGIGYEMLSGNSQTDTASSYLEVNHAFTPLYGTNHKFNGWMDYFYVGNHVNNVGLNDLVLKLAYKKDKILGGAHFHYFMANADVLDVVETTNSGNITAMAPNLGMELDTYVGYKLSKGVLFKAGFSAMFDSETMRVIKGGDYAASNYWGWAMIVVKPTFFNSADIK